MRFHFGDCVLDADRRELRRAAGSVPVEPQVFDLLLHLLRERERVVSKDDLLAAVWGGRVVSESTLSGCINAARRAVGDFGAEQGLIRTYARRGFRFVGAVREEAAGPGAVADGPAAGGAPTMAGASVGEGPETLVRTANWLTHLEHDWRSPFCRTCCAGRRRSGGWSATTRAAPGCRTAAFPTSPSAPS